MRLARVALYLGAGLISGCESDGFSFLETITQSDDEVECAITTQAPIPVPGAAYDLKVSGASGSLTTLSVGTSAPGCDVAFKLNGSALVSDGATVSIDANEMLAGLNLIEATSGGVSVSWNIYKNSVPLCASQTPGTTGTSLSPGGSTNLTGHAADADSDVLAFAWTLNGYQATSPILSTFNAASSSLATFSPDLTLLGPNSIAMLISDGTDTVSCSWNVTVNSDCVVSSTTPTAGTSTRVAAAASTVTSFQALAPMGCLHTWKLNGQNLPGATGSSTLSMASSSLDAGSNILEVTVGNGASTDTKTWTVVKNTPPSCSGQSPGSVGTTIGVGATPLALTADATDANSADVLSFSWKRNGASVSNPMFSVVPSGATSSIATFTPDSTTVGSNIIRADISDGYDTSSCTWTVQVVPVCSVGSSSPNGSSLKVPHADSSSQTFVATPNDPSCAVSWRINGNIISGATNPLYSVTSSQLGTGSPNTVEAVMTNGYTTATRSWSVVRNTPPSCDRTPVGSAQIGVGGTQDLTATITNTDNDPILYTWTRNGTAVNPSHFTLLTSGNSSTVTFMPTSAYIGANSISASVTDGYDSTSCAWTVNVANNCGLTASFPATTVYKVSASPSAAHVFGVIPSDSSCTVSWTLNGGALSPGPLANFTSGDLLTSGSVTPNTLVATLTNASGSTTRSWSVIKNQVPACGSLNTPVTSVAPAMNFGATASFSGTAVDPDSDPLSSFLWKFNGNSSPTLFNPVNTVGNTSATTFNPTVGQVGASQSVSLNFTDGYDAGACSWSIEVQNPNTVEILACQPTNSPASPVVVASAGAGATQTLTVVASNASEFSWFRNGSALGVTTATLNVSPSGLSPGIYNYRAIANDAQGNSDECDFSVKINSPPTVDLISPAAGTYKVNYGDELAFSVSASDANGDALSYVWTLNGSSNAALPSGSAAATFSPGYNPNLLGTNTVSVTISDGAESVVRTWTVEVNQFSPACNNLYNSPVSTHGGKVCTLVGVPGIGEGVEAANPTADQTKVRLRPTYLSEDDEGNLFISDALSSVVAFFNRSSSSVTRFGRTVPPRTLTYILGNGADGITIDGVSTNNFKVNSPMGTAYDGATGSLYVADFNNHRVVRVGSNGVVTTVVGSKTGSWQGNSTAFNTDGNFGVYKSVSEQGHSCASPVGLSVFNDSNVIPARRWLYIACSHIFGGASASIKKLDIDPDSAQYGRVWTVIGRTVGGVIQNGNVDGWIGQSGEATLNEPWDIKTDALGNLYWIERPSFRLRMATTAGNPMTFFGNSGHLTQNQTIWASDVTSPGPLATPTASTTSQTYTTGTIANKVALMGPVSVETSSCNYFSVQIQDSNSLPMAVASATSVTLSASGGGSGAFFSDSSCSSALVGSAVTVGVGQSQAGFFYRNSVAAANAAMTAASAGLASASITPIQVASPVGVAARLLLYGPTRSLRTECTRYTLRTVDGTGKVATSAASRSIRVLHNGIGTFYTNGSCSGDPIYTVNIPAGQASATFYYTPIIRAAANQVVSLPGGVVNNISPPSGSQAVGVTAFRSPRGFAIHQDGSGNVLGFFVSNSDQHRIHYLNNTTSPITLGGTLIGGYETGVVAGTGVANYNGDAIGNTARVNWPYGMHLRQNGGELLISDHDNYRVRTLNIAVSSGVLDTLLGAGRARSGNLGDSPLAATSMYLNGPSQLVVDNSSRKLYVSDTSSQRIRRVDLLTGEVDTAVGRTGGINFDDNETPTNASISAPRGLALMSSGSDRFLLYSDFPNSANPNATTVNSSCLVRALNLTPETGAAVPGSLFGISMNPSRVYTVAGDYVKGCYQWNASSPSAANVVGAVGTSNKLFNPDGIASDGQNLFIANYSDHCILKMSAAGALTVAVGTCGTAGATAAPALGNLFQISYPTGVAVDPLYAADGNFFFIDRSQNNPSRVNYVNCRSSAVQIGATSVNGTPLVTSCNVATIWNTGSLGLAPSGQAYGIAAFGSQVCFAAGQPGSGTNGAHNVSCFDRSSPLSSQTLRLGSYEGGDPAYRAGGPLASEQEGVPAYSAVLNAPFGLAFDSAGNLYVSERGNSLVRMVRRWW